MNDRIVARELVRISKKLVGSKYSKYAEAKTNYKSLADEIQKFLSVEVLSSNRGPENNILRRIIFKYVDFDNRDVQKFLLDNIIVEMPELTEKASVLKKIIK